MLTLLKSTQKIECRYIQQEMTKEVECIKAVDRCLTLLDKEIEDFRALKVKNLQTQAFSILFMTSEERIVAYKNTFSFREIAYLSVSILNQINECLPVDIKLENYLPIKMNLQGLSTADDLLLNIKKTMFFKHCIGQLNGFAWEQAISSMGLSSIEETVLKKYIPCSYTNMDLSQDEYKKMENLTAAALIGVLDNMLVDFKKQLRDQIVNRVYGQSKEVTLQDFRIPGKDWIVA